MIAVGDWRAAPIADGTRLLVEASAGTGKTWTIAALYLRLVLERGLSPRRIVVATFTNKAADELRERLRERLRGARALADPDAVVDPAASPDREWLAARWVDPARRADDRHRLDAALGDFDRAPIGTLHRLADRILREQPFATGAGLGRGAAGDGAELRDELARDLRRILLQDPGHPLSQLAAAAGTGPSATDLGRALSALLAAGAVVADDDPTADARLTDPALRARIERVLARREALFRSNAAAPRALEALSAVLDHAAPWRDVDVGDALECLHKFGLRTGFRKGADGDPDLEWFVINAERLAAAVREIARLRPLRAFWRAVGAWARAEARRRLDARGESSFDALLETVHDALAAEDGASGRPLADALHALWPAALVDEFQDTDPVQYGILDRIWRGDDRQPRGWLAIVGDPKQAIYRFRGGDIDTYLRARDSSTATLTLSTNHRSAARFVAACNAFFGAGSAALSARDDGEIRYVPVASARTPDHPAGLRLDGAEPAAPLTIRTIATPSDGLGAEDLIARAVTAAADEIAGLLGCGRHTIAGRPLEPADIAVLVPANAHVAAMLDALAARRVPAVGSQQSSVFDTDTARDLVLVLAALVEPHESTRRAALATRLLGRDWATLRRIVADPSLAAATESRLDGWREIWRRLGIGAAIRALCADIAPRVLADADGERVLTDLRHLGELLELAAADHHGPHALLAWLKRQRRISGGSEADVDARRMRLESDARRVQVMTVHAAKGLEFGIVFLPLAFRHGLGNDWAKAPLVRVSRPNDPAGLLDLPAAVGSQAARAESDERFRLFYVAVTRAIHACVIYDAPAPQKMTDVPLATLIARHRRAAAARRKAPGAVASATTRRAGRDPVRSFVVTDPARVQAAATSPSMRTDAPAPREAQDDAGARPAIDGIAWCEGMPEAASLDPAGGEARPRRARPLPPPAPGPRPGRHSFTSLSKSASGSASDGVAPESAAEDEAGAEADALDGPITAAPAVAAGREADVAVPDDADPALLALEPLRGIGFGDAVHAILERRVHGRAIVDQPDLVWRALAQHGIPGGHEALVAEMLDRALATPLWPGGPAAADLAPRDQSIEFAFVLPLPRLSMAALRRIAIDLGEPDLVPESDREVAGLLRGQIDLVFRHEGRYRALDWKTSRLGVRVADYLGESLDRAMDGHHYRFQALLYTLALDRHLRARLGGYERARHLGAPVYVFVRGAGLAPGAGIWSRPFDPALLDAVDALLDGRDPPGGSA
jgi:exodeoxyribonuclease V beta subunit